jgi:hypothetical protein
VLRTATVVLPRHGCRRVRRSGGVGVKPGDARSRMHGSGVATRALASGIAADYRDTQAGG